MLANTETMVERTPSPAVSLADAPVTISPETVLQEWADKITDASGQAVEKILAIGQLLLAARKALRHGQWERLFKGHPQAVANPVPFSVATAKMHMKIAAHPILSNRNLGNCLPPSWRALYELTFLPEPYLDRALAFGLISPELRKADAVMLRYFCATPRLHRAPPRSLKRHLRGYADSIDYLEGAQVILHKYVVMVDAELRAPLRIGEDGRIESGVFWLPPVPGGTIAPAAKPVHRCTCPTCGYVHADQRATP